MPATGRDGGAGDGATPPPRARASRRGLVVAVALAVLAGAVAAVLRWGPWRDRGPNVVLVVVDTVRADRCSLYGYGRPTTPHIDRFAQDAVVFSDAWSDGSWTVPAHAALFTGEDISRLDWFAGLDNRLEGSTTLAERLAAHGWDTGAFSANPWISPATELTRGFAKIDHTLRRETRFMPASDVVDAALAWVGRARGGRPYFLYVNLMEPHAPYDPPAETSAQFLREGLRPAEVASARSLVAPLGLLHSSLTGTRLPEGVEAAISDLYDAEIATADAQVGRLLDALAADGSLDRTVVVVASDHGEGLGDHGWREHSVRLNRELLRVPLVVRYPGVFTGGRREPGLVRLTDVVPTVLARCGIAAETHLDGIDLAVRAPRVALATDRPYGAWTVLAPTQMPPDHRAQLTLRRWSVYDGRYHAIADETGSTALFDVAADPAELDDISQREPALAERLRAAFR